MSSWRLSDGSTGGTPPGSIPRSATFPRPSSKPLTTLTTRRPAWPVAPKPSLYRTRGGSALQHSLGRAPIRRCSDIGATPIVPTWLSFRAQGLLARPGAGSTVGRSEQSQRWPGASRSGSGHDPIATPTSTCADMKQTGRSTAGVTLRLASRRSSSPAAGVAGHLPQRPVIVPTSSPLIHRPGRPTVALVGTTTMSEQSAFGAPRCQAGSAQNGRAAPGWSCTPGRRCRWSPPRSSIERLVGTCGCVQQPAVGDVLPAAAAGD